MKTKERIEWIDILKGIGIILVMLGHAVFPQSLRVIIYSFHMPLFFFLSGITLNTDIDFKTYFNKRVRGIILPLVYFSIVHIIVVDVLYNGVVARNISIMEAFSKFLGIILQFSTEKFSSFWYLACMFTCEIAIYFICKLSDKMQKVIIVIGVILTCFYVEFIGVHLPWCMEIVSIAAFFMYIGRMYGKNRENWKKIIPLFSSIIYACICIVMALINSDKFISGATVNMASSTYGNYVLFFVSALSGILAMLAVFTNINIKCLKIQFVGRNSMIYYCLHNIVFIFPEFVAYHALISFTYNVIGQLAIGIGYLIFTLPILYFATIFINQKMPFVLGKKVM